MSKPYKPWFKFQKGSKKSKDSSPLSTFEPSNQKHDTPGENNNDKKKNNNSKTDQLKQSSISKFFASPARGCKRPLADENSDETEGHPPKRINDNGENARKAKEQLAQFQFDSREEDNGVESAKTNSRSEVEVAGARGSEIDDNICDRTSISNDESPISEKGDGGKAKNHSDGEKKSPSNCQEKKSKSAGSWFPAAKGEAKGGSKGKSAPTTNGAKIKYTPLEQQFVDLKKQYPDAILLIECGYKFRFFGDDADVAAQVLNIVSHPDHNFNTASIPTPRLFVHVRRLVAKGHKVGVVKQTETAALKASSDSKSGLFQRSLSALYTKSTLVGQDVDALKCGYFNEEDGDDVSFKVENINETNTGILMCVKECPIQPKSSPKQSTGSRFEDVRISLVAVSPSTGKINTDSFNDSPSRSALEARLATHAPCEVLLPSGLSRPTEKILERFCRNPEDVRMERMGKPMVDAKVAAQRLSLYCNDSKSSSRSTLLDLDSELQICVVALIDYLKDFRLDAVFKSSSSSSSFSHLRMPATAIRNLELFANLADGKEEGTLIKVLNQTRTKFGDRLLRKWMSTPLLDKGAIEMRFDAVGEAMKDESGFFGLVKNALKGMMDLERGLTTIFYKKCSIQDFLTVVSSLSRLQSNLASSKPSFESVSSPLIRDAFETVEEGISDVNAFLHALDQDAVRSGDKRRFFRRLDDFPKVVATLEEISAVELELKEHLKEIRRILSAPSMEFSSVSGKEYLVEVKLTKANESIRKRVPDDWISVQSIKTCSRYHTPFVAEKYKKLLALREQLDLDIDHAWMMFLDDFNAKQFDYQRAVQSLASIDVVMGLADVAKNRNYSRPQIVTEERTLKIEEGRHPIIEVLIGESAQFVPNDTNLSQNGERCIIVTGPNMGGKSSYIRQVALTVIMAQMGSFIPASSARLSIFDGVFVRMGASDQIFRGASTFMVEMTEASEIMRDASANSLVILDELGRGTSTHDGTAIATATLEHFVRDVEAFTLFVTHYPLITKLADKYPGVVNNYHMSFMLDDEGEASDSASTSDASKQDAASSVQMLYSLTGGKADRSFGLNVGIMAGIEPDVIKKAAEKSKELEDSARMARRLKSFLSLLKGEEIEIEEQEELG